MNSPLTDLCVTHSRLCLRNLFPQFAGTLAKETQQARVYFFRVRPRDTVRSILQDQLARSFDELGGAKARGRDGKDAIGIPLNHQRGNIDASQVFAEVFVPSRDTCQAGVAEAPAAMFQLA